MTALAPTAPVAETLFPDLDLGDVRRNRRFARVVETLGREAGTSLPELLPKPADYAACLRLFDAPTCTHEAILAAHQTGVLDALERDGRTVLLLHDATTLDFSGHTTLEDELGPVGNGGGRGWIAHQTLAVDPETQLVFGLVSQILHVRPESTRGETVAVRRDRRSRESRLWERGLDEIGPTPAGCRWIDVCDRGADLFEFLQVLRDRGRRFAVRSSHNRALGSGPSDAKAVGKLHDELRALPATATWTLNQPAKAGVGERTATLSGAALRLASRCPESANEPATTLVPALWVEVSSRLQSGRPKAYTAREFRIELARAGGYMKNPDKHPPGWMITRRGWTRFRIILNTELSRLKMC